MIHYPQLISNSLISVAFSATFIGLFFFTYAKTVEKQIVLNNLNYTVNGLLGNFITLLNNFGYGSSLNFISLASNNNDEEAKLDEKVEHNNNILLEQASLVLGTFLVLILIIVFMISEKYNLNFKTIIYENLILLTGIAIVEFIFLNCVGRQYISADNNIVIKKILSLLSKNN